MRDELSRLPGEEPVGLRVVDLPARDRHDQVLEILGVHLVVRVHHDGDVDAVLECLPVAGDDRSADPAVVLAGDDGDPRVAVGRDPCPFDPEPQPRLKEAIWVEPQIVVEVEFTEWTGVGILRHPSYKGQRDDKDPREVVREVGA